MEQSDYSSDESSESSSFVENRQIEFSYDLGDLNLLTGNETDSTRKAVITATIDYTVVDKTTYDEATSLDVAKTYAVKNSFLEKWMMGESFSSEEKEIAQKAAETKYVETGGAQFLLEEVIVGYVKTSAYNQEMSYRGSAVEKLGEILTINQNRSKELIHNAIEKGIVSYEAMAKGEVDSEAFSKYLESDEVRSIIEKDILDLQAAQKEYGEQSQQMYAEIKDSPDKLFSTLNTLLEKEEFVSKYGTVINGVSNVSITFLDKPEEEKSEEKVSDVQAKMSKNGFMEFTKPMGPKELSYDSKANEDHLVLEGKGTFEIIDQKVYDNFINSKDNAEEEIELYVAQGLNIAYSMAYKEHVKPIIDEFEAVKKEYVEFDRAEFNKLMAMPDVEAAYVKLENDEIDNKALVMEMQRCENEYYDAHPEVLKQYDDFAEKKAQLNERYGKVIDSFRENPEKLFSTLDKVNAESELAEAVGIRIVMPQNLKIQEP